MFKLTLKDGDILEINSIITASEVAKKINLNLYKEATSARIDDMIVDLRFKIKRNCKFEILTFNDNKKPHWKTTSHILAHAVKRIYPDVKLAGGSLTDSGFYYDFDTDKSFTKKELRDIEAEMEKIINEKISIDIYHPSYFEAVNIFSEKGENYIVELIQASKNQMKDITFYSQDNFIDFSDEPLLLNTSDIKAFKLLQTTGAYWKSNSNNKMLCRIYGVSFPQINMLNEYILDIEEAENRSHVKIGKELGIFTTSELIGQGLPILLPNGAKIIQILQRFVEDEEEKRGWELTKTPFIAKNDLYKISGHWDLYKEDMFIIGDEKNDGEILALRPMTCPFQYQIYLDRAKSYKDLPVRYNETSTLFRNESSGEMHGLIRLRQFTISEGHLMCRPDQLEDEFRNCLDLSNYMLQILGLLEDVSYRFSQWDPENKGKYIGTEKQWEESQNLMQKILNDLDLEYKTEIGEAAFYGPKLDIQIRNVHGKEDTIITIQIDLVLAQAFGMEYVDRDGLKKNPFIIHRTSIGCYERTLALLIEKYAGAFPVWIAPVQIIILTVSEKYFDYAEQVYIIFVKSNFRVKIDNRNEKLGYKIREAQKQKIPYFIIIGEKEKKFNNISVRKRNDNVTTTIAINEFIEDINEKIKNKAKDI